MQNRCSIFCGDVISPIVSGQQPEAHRLPHPTGDKFVLIGGQHIALALLRRKQCLEAAHLPVPRTIALVRATVLGPETPKDVRTVAAGEHQYQQTMVVNFKISQILHLLLLPEIAAIKRPVERLARVLLVSGNKDSNRDPV